MMKKLSKIGAALTVFLGGLYTTCFADVIMPGQNPAGHGIRRYPDGGDISTVVNSGINPLIIFAILAVLGIIIAACTVAIIIVVLSKTKKKDTSKEENK